MDKEARANFYGFAVLSLVVVVMCLYTLYAAVTVSDPTSGTNVSTSLLLNVTFTNADFGFDVARANLTSVLTNHTGINQTVLNATFYSNASGSWALIGASTSCIINITDNASIMCWGTINPKSLGLTQGRISINATIWNATSNNTDWFINVGSASVVPQIVGIDYTPPVVSMANFAVRNYSNASGTTGGIIFINISVVDSVLGVDPNGVWINITNVSGGTVNWTNLTNQGVTNYWRNNYTVINLTTYYGHEVVGLKEGRYNITIYANDTKNNINLTIASRTAGFFVDNTPPQSTNITVTKSAVTNGYNYTGTITINASVYDAVSGVARVYFKFVTANASSINNGTFTASLEDSMLNAAGSGIISHWSASINTASMMDGNYTVTMYVNDSAGNQNATAATLANIGVDNTAPTALASCTPTEVETGETVTCSCAGTDNFAEVNSTTATSTPSTSNTGTFTYTCQVWDSAGNRASDSSTTYRVTASSGGTIGGGGSGGGATTTVTTIAGTTETVTWTTAETVTQAEFTAGVTTSIEAEERVKYTVDMQEHFIGVAEVTDTSAVITITDLGVQKTLAIGETAKFDTDSDGVYDTSVSLNSISAGKADLTMKAISEEVPETELEAETEESAAAGISIWWWIGGVIVIIAIVAAVIARKKK